MKVVLDTNSLVRVFGRKSPFAAIEAGLREGRLTLAVSTPILLEYEEVIVRYSNSTRWQDLWRFFCLIGLAHGNVHNIGPQYRFHTIIGDPDDDKFADCAIVADADFIITEDKHFRALIGTGYKPQPITPQDFVSRFL